MSYRKITVDQKDYNFCVGKSHTKIQGVGVFENTKIGDKISGTKDFVVTPYNVANAIKGIHLPREVMKCSHGTVTHEVTLNPFDAEVFDISTEMIACKKCVQSCADDI